MRGTTENPDNRVRINLCGEIFETYEHTLSRFPNTLLGNRKSRDCYYNQKSRGLYFDRNKSCFEAILYFYQSNGRLNCPDGIPVAVFESECRYFGISTETINELKRREGIIFDLEQGDAAHKAKETSFRSRIWNFLEHPNFSKGAWFFGCCSLTMVWVSIFTALVATMATNEGVVGYKMAELVLNVWFFLEVTARFTFCPCKWGFLQDLMNWIDFLSVVPFFVFMIVQTDNNNLLGFFKTLKFVRVLRLFRLSKHSRRLKVVGVILRSCLGNFRLCMTCLFMVSFLGAAGIYIFESQNHNDNKFVSVPISLWWGIQTITLVGYGDLVPMTTLGRGFAICFMIFGVLTVALPVLTVVSQFSHIYPKNVEWEAFQHREETAKQQQAALKEKTANESTQRNSK